MIEVPNDYVMVNENPPLHNKEIKEEVEFENVEEGKLKLQESLPLIRCYINISCHF